MPTPFTLKTDLEPTRRSAAAIEELVGGVKRGDQAQVLLGITGSGKTFTMANVIAAACSGRRWSSRHNKTLAASSTASSRTLFPDNAVHYFVSYYDYYQPEAYVPSTRHVHREGLDHQRRDRPHAPRGDATRCSRAAT